ncbi:hypothetical protein GPB2148_3378 [marine gamma proteobacterium HTCC2148]|nr:hypothetical protein GPB2148_3378 [marine gamma proteobacterium HTCC2148]
MEFGHSSSGHYHLSIIERTYPEIAVMFSPNNERDLCLEASKMGRKYWQLNYR